MIEDLYPEGLLVKVTMEIRVPKAATAAEIDEWLRYSLGDSGPCSMKNPLVDCAVETFGPSGFDCKRSDEIGREERTLKEERADGSKIYSVRFIREQAP